MILFIVVIVYLADSQVLSLVFMYDKFDNMYLFNHIAVKTETKFSLNFVVILIVSVRVFF